ncbi:MAG: 3-chlorobenzoate-3,4-dioxygenase [Planctomycetaceae bacterium]|nr:3-chlorobenzoate-3,4-dioxygenase [Planctomycetaceae bacterium]
MATKLRVGVLGSTKRGDYGHGLDTAWFAVDSTEIVAVADDNKAGMAKAASRLKVDKSFTDYRELLDKVEVDIIAICPRWVDQHFAMALAAAERGVHVYMEKPFCRTLEEADKLVEVCEKNKAKVAIAHPTRYSPLIETIKGIIKAGHLGQVLEYRGRGKEDRRGGGEDLWVLGAHIMDMILAIGGRPKDCYARVQVDGHAAGKKDVITGAEGIGPLTGDSIQARYSMPDGSTAYFNSIRNMGGNPRRYGLQIYGSKGIIELIEGTIPSVKFLGDSSWSPGRTGKEWQHVSSAGIGQPEPLTGAKYKARHTLAIEDFVDAIRNNRQPLCNMLEGRWITEMIAGVFESHRQGGPVALPLKTRVNPLTLYS